MTFRLMGVTAALLLAGLTAGCANDGGLLAGSLTTASVPESKPAVAKVDPQCFALMAKIDELRKEGTPGRIEKLVGGKGATANVKRTSLAKITELDKANADFQARCSTLSQQASAAPAVAPAAAPANVAAAAQSAAAPAASAASNKATQTVAKATTKAVAKTQ